MRYFLFHVVDRMSKDIRIILYNQDTPVFMFDTDAWEVSSLSSLGHAMISHVSCRSLYFNYKANVVEDLPRRSR